MKQNKLIAMSYKNIVIVIAILAGIPLLLYSLIIVKFNSIKVQTLQNLPRHMIWAHRGFTQGFRDNSIESFDAARSTGYYGIEIDIHFLEGKGFIVAHDISPKMSDNNSVLSLDTVFKRYTDQFYYWLDFKNLDTDNAAESGKILSDLVRTYHLQGHVFIESQRARALRKLKSVGPEIHTIYWLHRNLENKTALFKAKYNTIISGADSVSLPAEHVSESFIENFSHLNMAVFTVNDAETIEQLFQRGVRVVLSDSDMRERFPQVYKYPPKISP